jgi:hypothetical protein
MRKRSRANFSILALALFLSGLFTSPVRAQDTTEKAGVAVGVTAGNMWFIPIKAISVSMGALSGALSFLVTGGNLELTQQIWQDTIPGPYLITPELAKKSVGERPELWSPTGEPVGRNPEREPPAKAGARVEGSGKN